MNGLNDNEREKQSTKRVPTETKMGVLISAKAKMLHTSRLYLRVEPTKTESNFSHLQPTAHSSAALTTR